MNALLSKSEHAIEHDLVNQQGSTSFIALGIQWASTLHPYKIPQNACDAKHVFAKYNFACTFILQSRSSTAKACSAPYVNYIYEIQWCSLVCLVVC